MPQRPLAGLAPVLLALLLTAGGCASLGPQAELPPSIDRAAGFELAGDPASAARVYEQLAAQNSGAERGEFLLRAARDYLTAQRTEDAARLLAQSEGLLTATQGTEHALLAAEVALNRGQGPEAVRLLAAVPEPTSAAQAARYHELRGRAAALAAALPLATASPPPVVVPAGPHIALLLPLTGRAAAATSVRDGFLTAYFETPAAERPQLRIYDTGTESIAAALSQAAAQGADFIVGPLTREEVTAAADFTAPRAALLALNFLTTERAPPKRFYQYALSPEDEARLAARRVLEDHHRRGIALVPAGDWGARVLAAFRQELADGGGELLDTGLIDSARTDYSATITDALRLGESTARNRRLEATLGTRLQFEPRRRGDIEFIFAPAPANLERLLRPQLRFHYAGDIPTYATSDAFEPDVRANQELDGLMFPDMPWMLGGEFAEAVRAAVRDAWHDGGPNRGRLFAFGFDAFRLAQAMRRPGAGSSVTVEGLTGRLSFDAQGRVRRELGWAQLHAGELRLLPASAP
jgi:outer membrane PBP1 activator LpoA protein